MITGACRIIFVVFLIVFLVVPTQSSAQIMVLKPDDSFANESIHVLEWVFSQAAWRFSSYNGLNYHPEPAVSGVGANRSPEILLDNVPVWTALFSDPLVTMYPVSLSNVDSVVVIREPGVYQGAFYPGGLIAIYTRKTPGFSLYYSTDNPVNDPGLFLGHDELNTVNVDRLKQNFQLRAVFSRKGRVFPIAAGVTTYSYTNPIYPGRVINESLNLRNPFYKHPIYFQTMAYVSSGMHWVTPASRWNTFKSVRYFPRLYHWDDKKGNEIPLQVLAVSAGFDRASLGSKGWNVTFSTHLTEANTYENSLDFDVSVRQYRGDFQVHKQLVSSVSVGVRSFYYHLYEVRSAGVQSNTRFDVSAVASVTLGNQLLLNAAAGNLFRHLELRKDGQFAALLSSPTYFLVTRLMNQSDAPSTSLSMADVSFASTGWLHQLGINWSSSGFSAGNTLEAVHWFNTGIATVHFSGDQYPLKSTFGRAKLQNAGVVQLRSFAGFNAEKFLLKSIFQIRLGVWGSDEFKTLNRRSAGLQFLNTVQWRLDQNLRLYASVIYRSDRYFHEFSIFEENRQVFPTASLPAFWRVSAGVTQYMFKQRLGLSLLLRNILHQYESNHPNGLYYPLILGLDIKLLL
jgi:hypothetical protein